MCEHVCMAWQRSFRSGASVDLTTQDGGMLQEDGGEEKAVLKETGSDVTTPTTPEATGGATGTWKLADLAEKQDIEALEAAFEDKQRVMEESVATPTAGSSTLVTSETGSSPSADPVPQEMPTAPDASPSKPARRPKGWDQLTLLEKDVLVVLMAFCKVRCCLFEIQHDVTGGIVGRSEHDICHIRKLCPSWEAPGTRTVGQGL